MVDQIGSENGYTFCCNVSNENGMQEDEVWLLVA